MRSGTDRAIHLTNNLRSLISDTYDLQTLRRLSIRRLSIRRLAIRLQTKH